MPQRITDDLLNILKKYPPIFINTHFNTSIDDGLEIMEYLRGYTSGMAIPTYIVNAPNGKGKTPILPQYLISRGKDYVTIRTWENEVFEYPTMRRNL